MSERELPKLVVTRNGVPFEDQAEGLRLFKEACLVSAKREEELKGTLPPRGAWVQKFGRAWRPGNKPRLKWNGIHRRYEYDTASILRIGRVCTYREIDVYSKIRIQINRMNGYGI